MVQYAGALRVLADKVYPNWTADQQGEVLRNHILRNHFIQGVSSPSVQLSSNSFPFGENCCLRLSVMMWKSVDSAKPSCNPEVEATLWPTGLQVFQSAAHKGRTASAIGPNQQMQYISVEGGGSHGRSEWVLYAGLLLHCQTTSPF